MNNESYYIITSDGELYHYGVKGMRWGHRKKIDYAGEGIVSRKKKQLPGYAKGGPAQKPTLSTSGHAQKMGDDMASAVNSARKAIKKGMKNTKKTIEKHSNSEIAKRGKSALDVLMNGDKDWMGNPINSDDIATEARNRGKAALERLMYSEDRINNKKFFGDYDF